MSRSDLRILIRAVPPEEREAVRSALSGALLRRARFESRALAHLTWILVASGVLGGLATNLMPWRDVSKWVSGLLIVVAGRMLLVESAAAWRVERPHLDAPVSLRVRWDELLRPRLCVAVLCLLTAVRGTEWSVAHNGWRSATPSFLLGAAVSLLVGLLAVGADGFAHGLAARVEEDRVLDVAAIELARAVADMTRLAPAWRRPDVARYLLERLERAARRVATRPSSHPVPLAQWRIRPRIQQPVDQLAAVIRAHRLPIASAPSRAGYDRVRASLVAGLIAAVHEDWGGLLAHADPVPARPWYTGYAAKNLGPAIVLGAAAVALPWLPPFRGSPASGLGLRVTLGVYALLRLIPGTSLVDLVDRGLTRGFSETKGK
ncbi:hypothetical protein GCM10009838_82410 [Catenulispora subtropica]|uniref:Integral membrane protein n=2 Tax=Catenulispora subtropica TaxID=450798 RepID=A0ABP5ER40_9ACTN